jgi:centromeric protein E
MQGGGCEGGGGVGIIHLAAKDIFQFIEDDRDSSNSECSVRVSYFEICNEELRDLLNDNDDRSKSSTSLIIREGKNGSIAVDGLREVEVTNLDQIMKVFKIGEKNKAVGSTKMNDRSSRSHAILKIAIDRRMVSRRTTFDEEDKENYAALNSRSNDSLVKTTTSVLNLVDLAGTESVRHTGASGMQKKEGGMINQR